MRSLLKTSRPYRYGFTLLELLVVISVIGILLGTLAAGTTMMIRSNQTAMAMNTIAAAVTASRAYATMDKLDLEDLGDPQYAGVKYSGGAVLFTPAGELRLVENDQLELYLTPDRNAYTDIPGREYLKMPSDAGVAGIARGASGLYLYTPPFAIRFDRNGSLISGQNLSGNQERLVYYDGDGDNTIQVSNNRTSAAASPPYNPDSWENSATFPIEEIETVVGVVVYSKRALRDAGEDHLGSGTSGSLNATATTWLLDPANNNRIMFFSRHSGTKITR